MADTPGKIESRRGEFCDPTLRPMVSMQYPFLRLRYMMVGKAKTHATPGLTS